MTKPYKVVVVDYQDFDSDGAGVSKDNHIDEANPTLNYGAGIYVRTQFVDNFPGANTELHSVLEITMPDEEDIDGFDKLEKVELSLYCCDVETNTGAGVTPDELTWLLAICSIDEETWDEGSGNDGGNIVAPLSNWTEAQDGVLWEKSPGAIKNRIDKTNLSEATPVIDTFRVVGDDGEFWVTFDITKLLNMGDKKTFVIYLLKVDRIDAGNDDESINVIYYSRHSIADELPKLSLTYRDYAPEGFIGEEDLTIEPNPDNREQPILKWGAVKSEDFVQYKLYRETAPITTVGALTPIATIADSSIVQYIDTDALVDGTTYYYKLIAEDNENLEDDALPSACVSFTKPDISGTSFTPSGDKIVGTQITITVDSPQNIKKIWVDWKDGCTSWYEFETVATSQDVSHIYSAHSAGVALEQDVRIEDENGFWSSLGVALGYKILDTDAVAKLLVNVKKTIVGDNVTLNATLSQPAASNATITSYKFWRYAGDPAPATQSSPIFTFSTVGYTVGTKTATVEITTSTSKTDTDTVTYELESGTPTEITPGYPTTGLSIHTKIHELPHTLGQSKTTELPIGSAGTEYEFLLARHAERLTIHATTEYPAMESDITIIRNAWINNSYLRLTVQTEMETKDIQYDFLLDGDVSLGHTMDNKITWSFPIRVIARTEVAKPKTYGAITIFADGGGGKVTVTSALHGLSNGMYVLITGTINYNGTYQVSEVAANTFKIVATWVSNDAMGTWRKVGV